MMWVMLFTGILLGWIIEWIIDTYRYNRMVERLQSEHSQAIIDVTNRYEATLEQERSRHEEYMGDLQERHRAELNLADIELNTRLTELTASHRQELEANQGHFQNELQLLESQRRDELNARDKTYAEAKEVLEQGYSEQVAQLKTEHEQRLRDTGASLRAQYEKEQELQTTALLDTQKREQDKLEARLRAEYEDQLAHARQNSAATAQDQIDDIESRLKRDFDHSLAQRDAQHRNEVAALKADYEQRIDEITLLSRSSHTTLTPADSAISLTSNNAIEHIQQDDLTIIEGIGPKANNLLHNAGINSYDDLAHADINTLQHILDDAGSRFKLLTPDTWPQQASLAARGDWEALDQLKGQLDGGKPAGG